FQSSNVFGYSEPFGEIDIEPMRLIEGTWPQGEGHKELVVERRLADKYGLGLGDKVVVRILSTGDSPSDEAFLDEEWAIVGLVFFPYGYEGGFNAVLAEDSLFASLDNVEYIAATKGLTSVYARFNRYTEAEAHYEVFIEKIVDETPYLSVYNFKEDP